MTRLVRAFLAGMWAGATGDGTLIRRLWCLHRRTRCIHGDEIIWAMSWWRGVLRRQRCLDCGRALDRPLPIVCTYTGAPHTPTIQEAGGR